MRTLLLLLLFTFTNSFSQDFLTPIKAETFALNRHTNRDISFFSNVDNNGDIIISATTERDSTFTDILTTKLDKDLNLIWKQRYSLGRYTSDDEPLAVHIDKNNNIITIGRTIVNNNSNYSGVLFALCYNSEGKEIWHYNFDDPNTPKNYNFHYQKSFLDENNILHVVNSVDNDDPIKVDVNFYSINDKGVVVEKFTHSDIIQYVGFYNVFNDFYYNEGFYYMLLQSYNVNTSEPNHYIKRIDEKSVIEVSLNSIIDIYDTDSFKDADLQFDKSNNIFFTYSSYKNGFFNVLKFNSSLKLVYKIDTPKDGVRHLLSTYLNLDDRLCILNSVEKNDVNNFRQLSLLELNDDGGIYKETVKNDVEVFNFKKNKDRTFFIETDKTIKLFDEKLSLVTDFQHTGLEINDFSKLDNETLIVAETTYEKGYPTSDFFSELDILVQKIQPEKPLQTYRYSGEGTSKAYGQKIIIDNKNNYIIASEEKLGPDNEGIGGSRGPVQRNLYKYDSNLKLLWTIEIPYYIVNPLSSEDKNIVVDLEDNIYINAKTENNSDRLLKISEDGNVVFDVPSYNSMNIYIDKNKDINVVSLPVSNSTTNDDDTTVFTLSSKNGNLINTTLFEGVEYLGNYTAKDGDSYIYMFPGNNNSYNNTNPRIEVYKNLKLEFQHKISLEGTYAGMVAFAIDTNGSLFFSSSYGPVEYKLHRLSLQNEYKYINLTNEISKIACTAGDKNFMISDNHQLSIYNKDLELLAKTTELYSSYASLFELGDYLLINTYWDNLVKVVDKNAQLVRSFKLPSSLTYTRAAKDTNNNLVLTGRNGEQIYTFAEYSWWRGFIHKYDILDKMLDIDDPILDSSTTGLKVYPNPTSSVVNIALEKDAILKVELYDFAGKLMLSYFNSNKVDIAKFPVGLYFVKIQLLSGQVFYKKIIKN